MQQPIQHILRAANFAAQKHAGQPRKGAAHEPYIIHPLEVAELIAGSSPELDVNLIIAALLHDTMEDAAVPKEELIQAFGQDVADLVAEVTDDKNLEKCERKRLQIANAPCISARAQTIKLADKISNLQAILSSPPVDWPIKQRQAYFDWAKQVADALTIPNPVLRQQFEALYAQKHRISE